MIKYEPLYVFFSNTCQSDAWQGQSELTIVLRFTFQHKVVFYIVCFPAYAHFHLLKFLNKEHAYYALLADIYLLDMY